MKTSDFHFDLPPERIAQEPLEQRDSSRLLVFDRRKEETEHHQFTELPSLLNEGDLLVVNNSKVLPARVFAQKNETGGETELLLLNEQGLNEWICLTRPAKRLRPGTRLTLFDSEMNLTAIQAEVTEAMDEGQRLIRFEVEGNIRTQLDELGRMPLPPYIEREKKARPSDWDRYQTVYSQAAGSVAAPTAGLHFTPELLEQLEKKGIKRTSVTLHVGLGTFQPVKVDDVTSHQMHSEPYEVSDSAAQLIQEAKSEGRRVIAVGTTSMRVLESAFRRHGTVVPETADTELFVYPPADFGIVDALITNFHLPESTLLMLISAFASPGSTQGIESIRRAYQTAIDNEYRFFSYGDAMLIQG